MLRNGGNDSILNRAQDGDNASMIRDAAVNNFAVKYAPAVATQASTFAAVYLNGEYYGILDMKEDIDEDYISNLYGIEDKENVTVVKSELDIKRECDGTHDENIPCGRFCGAWFYYDGDRLGQGKENVRKLIESDKELMDKLEALVREKVQSGEADEDAALGGDDFEISDFDEEL